MSKKQDFPVWGGGAAKLSPKSSPPQEAEFSPKSGDSGGVTSSHHVAEVPEDATGRKKAPAGRQGSHVTSGVRGERTQLPRLFFNLWLYQETFFTN
jgi:hypothetical protein